MPNELTVIAITSMMFPDAAASFKTMLVPVVAAYSVVARKTPFK
jgi:hypothetical protein